MRAGARLRITGVVTALLTAIASFTHAQVPLVVDGREVAVARTDLVPGSAFAPIDRLAPALGARWLVGSDGGTIVASLGGHLVVLDVVDDASAAAVEGAMRLDGAPTGNLAAIRLEGDLWTPVASFARAFGGSTSFLGDPPTVTIVSARGNVLDVRASTASPSLDVASVTFDAPVRLERQATATPGRFEWLVPRALARTASTSSAGRIARFDLVPTNDGVLLRLDARGASVEAIETAAGTGTTVRFRVEPDPVASSGGNSFGGAATDSGAAANDEAASIAAIVLEADGSAAAGAFVDDLIDRLGTSGAVARVVNALDGEVGEAARREASANAAVYLAVHAAALPQGEVRLWVLGEWDDGFASDPTIVQRAVALSGSNLTDELRREILLGLVPDVSVGQNLAQRLATTLFDVGGYRSGSPLTAPIAGLRAAGGRGVVLEASVDTLADRSFVEAMAAALRDVTGGTRP